MDKRHAPAFWIVMIIIATGASIWVDDYFRIRTIGMEVFATASVFVGVYLLSLPLQKGKGWGIVSAWAVWALCVFAYDNMFNAYIDYEVWLTLPPVCVAAVYIWLSYFVFKPK